MRAKRSSSPRLRKAREENTNDVDCWICIMRAIINRRRHPCQTCGQRGQQHAPGVIDLTYRSDLYFLRQSIQPGLLMSSVSRSSTSRQPMSAVEDDAA